MVNRIPSPQSPNKVSRRILPVPHINKDQSLFKGDWDRILGRGDKEYPSEDQRSEGSHSSLEDVFQKEMIHLVKYGGTGSLSGFLNRHPEVDINYKDEKGYTALHYAAFGGDVSKVKELLLISGVDIDCPSGNRSRSEDKMRNTPLFLLTKLSRQNPESGYFLAQKALVLERIGNHELAIKSMREATLKEPQRIDYKFNLAVIYDRSEKFSEALESYYEVMKSYQNDSSLAKNIPIDQVRLRIDEVRTFI